jgi:hypothetical protein
MATLKKPSRLLGLTGCLGDLGTINTLTTIISNSWFSNMFGSGWKFGSFLVFLLLNLPFSSSSYPLQSFGGSPMFGGLLASDLSRGEEDETEEDLASEEGEEDLTGEEGEGST